jgi:hypothetical protein
MPPPRLTLYAPPLDSKNSGEGSKWEIVDYETGSPLSSPRKLEARNKALTAYWETFEQVNGNHDDPALRTAFRWLRIFCEKYEHEWVYRERWEEDGIHPAALIYKCQICGAIEPCSTQKGWSSKVALLSDKPERHDPANPLSRRWPVEDIPVPNA